MSELILHIGHPKTATTSIQSYLSLNANNLLSFNIEYPRSYDMEQAIKEQITSGNGRHLIEQPDYRHRKPYTLYSSEYLFYDLLEETKFCRIALENFSRINVILYTRNIMEFLISSWGQHVKRNGLTSSLNDFLAKNHEPTYDMVLQWIQMSEKLNFKLAVKNYSNHKHDILGHFMGLVASFSKLDKNFTTNFKTLKSSNINRSMSQAEYSVLQCLNSIDPIIAAQIADAWCERLPMIKGETPPISSDVIQKLKKQYENLTIEINEYLDESEKILFDKPGNQIGNTMELSTFHVKLFKDLAEKILYSEGNGEGEGIYFDPIRYLDLNLDVKAAGVDPVQPYINYGLKEGRRIR